MVVAKGVAGSTRSLPLSVTSNRAEEGGVGSTATHSWRWVAAATGREQGRFRQKSEKREFERDLLRFVMLPRVEGLKTSDRDVN